MNNLKQAMIKMDVWSFHLIHTRQLYLIMTLILIGLSSCGGDDEDPTPSQMDDLLSVDQRQAVNYFNSIALGFEFGNASRVTRKWTQDVVIFVDGTGSQGLLNELDIVIADINRLIDQSGIELRITNDISESNYFLFLGSGSSYANLVPNASPFIQDNFGLFFVSFDVNDEITNATMYVDIIRASPRKQRHLLREELTQSLGLAMDSPLFSDSIFQSSFALGCSTSFADIDEVIIQMLYDPRIRTGLDEIGLLNLLEEIVGDYV